MISIGEKSKNIFIFFFCSSIFISKYSCREEKDKKNTLKIKEFKKSVIKRNNVYFFFLHKNTLFYNTSYFFFTFYEKNLTAHFYFYFIFLRLEKN